MKVIYILTLSFGFAITGSAQSDSLNKAFDILKAIDERLSKNPNDTLTPGKRRDLDMAIDRFEKAGRSYELSLALFYRANTAENMRWPRQMFIDLEKSRNILETARGDSTYLLLGHIWNAYSAYYNTFRFDFQKSAEALGKSKSYYKKANHLIGQVESTGNNAFTLSLYGQGSLALARAKECETEFNKLSAAELKRADVTRSFIDFLFGNAHFILCDSLVLAGEHAAAKQHILETISYLDRIVPGNRVDLPRLANTWFLKGSAYTRLNTYAAWDSALVYFGKATEIFAFAGATPQSPFGLGQVLKGSVLLRMDSIALGESLIVSGFKNLGFPPADFYSERKPLKDPTLLQLQAIIAKISAMDVLRQKRPEQKLLEQIVFDTETFAQMIEVFKYNYKDRQSLERLSDLIAPLYGIGVAAARDLAGEGRENAEDWKKRGFNLSELGKGFALRYNITKRLLPDESETAYINERAERNFYTLDSIRQILLDDHTAAIEYSVAINKTTAIVITKDETKMVSLPPLDQWKRDVETADSLLRASREITAYSSKLYKVLVAPLVKGLPNSIRHLIIVPDGILWRLNFDALITGRNEKNQEQFLIESYALSQSYSLQITAMMAEHGGGLIDPSLGVCVGDFEDDADSKVTLSQKFTALPLLRELADSIAEQWSADKPETQLTRFKNDLAKYNIVLIVTHGKANKTLPPEEYFLAFSKDSAQWLYVKDIYKIKTGRNQMIFLAACLTAYGASAIRGEGLPSLARAFHYAGVPTLITASVEITDEATAEIARVFFTEIKKGQLTAAEALRAAKIAYLRNPAFETPSACLWSPLICLGYGNWKI